MLMNIGCCGVADSIGRWSVNPAGSFVSADVTGFLRRFQLHADRSVYHSRHTLAHPGRRTMTFVWSWVWRSDWPKWTKIRAKYISNVVYHRSKRGQLLGLHLQSGGFGGRFFKLWPPVSRPISLQQILHPSLAKIDTGVEAITCAVAPVYQLWCDL